MSAPPSPSPSPSPSVRPRQQQQIHLLHIHGSHCAALRYRYRLAAGRRLTLLINVGLVVIAHSCWLGYLTLRATLLRHLIFQGRVAFKTNKRRTFKLEIRGSECSLIQIRNVKFSVRVRKIRHQIGNKRPYFYRSTIFLTRPSTTLPCVNDKDKSDRNCRVEDPGENLKFESTMTGGALPSFPSDISLNRKFGLRNGHVKGWERFGE